MKEVLSYKIINESTNVESAWQAATSATTRAGLHGSFTFARTGSTSKLQGFARSASGPLIPDKGLDASRVHWAPFNVILYKSAKDACFCKVRIISHSMNHQEIRAEQSVARTSGSDQGGLRRRKGDYRGDSGGDHGSLLDLPMRVPLSCQLASEAVRGALGSKGNAADALALKGIFDRCAASLLKQRVSFHPTFLENPGAQPVAPKFNAPDQLGGKQARLMLK